MSKIVDFLKDNSLILLLSLATVLDFVWLLVAKERIRLKWWQALVAALFHTVLGVLSVKAFAWFETMDFSNMSLFGGIFLMPIYYFAFSKVSKRSAADCFDCFAVCIILTLALARVNCIISGCCKGAYIPGTDGLRFPTRELEIIFHVILLVIFIRKVLKNESRGEIYPLYMISYGVFRFVTEFFRAADSPFGIIHLGHIWAIVSFCVGLSVYSSQRTRKNKKAENSKSMRRK